MSKISLSKQQTLTVIENICKLRHLSPPKEIFSGKPKWDDKIIEQYKYD